MDGRTHHRFEPVISEFDCNVLIVLLFDYLWEVSYLRQRRALNSASVFDLSLRAYHIIPSLTHSHLPKAHLNNHQHRIPHNYPRGSQIPLSQSQSPLRQKPARHPDRSAFAPRSIYGIQPDTMENVDPADLYRQGPPTFGHELLKYFALDPEYINLNHGTHSPLHPSLPNQPCKRGDSHKRHTAPMVLTGSFGSSPYVVHKVANDLNLKLESNPDRFLRLEYLHYLTDVREKLAKMVNAKRDEIVLVPNASVGINTVLRNFEWEEGDVIVYFNTSYKSIYQTAHNLADIHPHPTLSELTLLFPTTPSSIISSFRAHIQSLPKKQGKKRVAIIDSIISNPGAYIPWQELVKICREEGVWSVVDAAHSIGQEQDIDLSEVMPDFWTSNCHKWLHAKRAVAMLYIPERNRDIIKTSHPTSHAYKPVEQRTLQDFLAQWEWNGTMDWIPFLIVGAALDFRKWIGGEAKIYEYCHSLALEGGRRMAEVFGTRVMDPNGEFTLNMVNVELPFPGSIPESAKVDMLFKKKMLLERNAYSAHFYHNGKWWTRCSAQVYNEISDFEKIARIWIEVCDEVRREVEKDNN
ncbi:hypothetical protein NP233_g12087 [Leucocoprinus birnbaumii]|uniref:Aminotransferase class V domain-containing protein n=1 Tax=Leucocoprinus birnbaumii TaxID=56174 RepID=A0AAD5YKR5_9AGAR|nr:hypothetical protein NP233_g12087 [Leucocoprinus birnbaumii]